MAFMLYRVDWKHFAAIAGRINKTDLLISFLLLALANLVRSFRFYQLDYMGHVMSLWWIMNQIYNFITATLPGGAGEAVTVYMLKRFSNFNILSAFRILLLTRFLDLAGFSALLLITALFMSAATPYREAALWLSGCVFILSVVLSHSKSERLIIRLLHHVPIRGRIMNKIFERLEEVYNASGDRLRGNFFIMTMLQSVLIIFIAALSVHFMLRALGTEFVLIQSLFCFGVYALFQMVPVQGIAGIGTQAAWWTLAITVSGYKASDAIAVGIILHGVFYVLIGILGLAGLLFWIMLKKNQPEAAGTG
jgi:uncharacterized membrane protein YbhN (UPF0104 family)